MHVQSVMALDPGSVRIGVAVTDPTHTIVVPLEIIPAEPLESRWARIEGIIMEREIGMIVVGLPRRARGDEGPEAGSARAFASALAERFHLPVTMWDERFTSAEAQRTISPERAAKNVRNPRRGGAPREKERVDSVAAALLLQGWLEHESITDGAVR